MSAAFLRFAAGVLLAASSASASAQAFTENFDDITQLVPSGWFMQNNSTPLGVTNWFQGNAVSAGGPFDAWNGAANAYIGANFNNTTGGTGTISNWLGAPNRTLRNGDVFTFYTRRPTTPAGGTEYPDRLEVRLSTNGASTNVGSGGAGLGDFTTLMLSVNPSLVTNVYPAVWTQYTITISGLPAPTSGRLAFRYFVTGAGPTGNNSDYIGIDNAVYAPYVCPTFTISPSSLPNANFGQAYSQPLSQTGALGAPAYAITAGALPPGLTISASGTISGTPTATGMFNFTVTVNDASGCSGSHAYSITVDAVVPGVPTNAAAVAGDAQADVSWDEPLSDGGSPITGYSATCTDGVGNVSASGTVSPIPVTGLVNGTAYTCTVAAINGVGPGPASAPSNSVTPMGNQTITFGAQAGRDFFPGGTFPIDPLATASSGLPVTYGSSTPASCTVSGTTVSMVAQGPCTITADQAGDGAWNPAPQVSQSLTIGPPTVADLWAQISADRSTARIGDTVTYTILVGNDGPADASNVRVLDMPPVRLDGASLAWECLEAVGTACPVPSGTGTLDVTMGSMPIGASMHFELHGTVIAAANPADDYTEFSNTATIALPQGSGLTDPGTNSQATAIVQVVDVIFDDGFEAPAP